MLEKNLIGVERFLSW